MRAFCQRIPNRCGKNTPGAVTCHPVEGSVGRVTSPGPLVNLSIGGVLSQNKRKHTADPILITQNIELLFSDILPQNLLRGIVTAPLIRISILRHKAAGASIDLQKNRKILRQCQPNLIFLSHIYTNR